MTTTDQVLLIVVTALLSIFLIICISVLVGVLKLIKSLREVVAKAEEVADSVESAAEVLRDTSGPLALFKLIRNIMKATQKGRRR